MIRSILLILILCSWQILALPASAAEIYIYNFTNERLNYTQNFPNGDSKSGVIKERSDSTYGDARITSSGSVVTCRVSSESGKSTVELKGTDSQVFLVVLKNGAMSIVSGAWTATNGQTQKREIRFLNATGKPVNFDIIDEKEIRKASVDQGHAETYPDKNTITSLRFESGQREDYCRIQPGDFWVLFTENNKPEKILLQLLGHTTPPISR